MTKSSCGSESKSGVILAVLPPFTGMTLMPRESPAVYSLPAWYRIKGTPYDGVARVSVATVESCPLPTSHAAAPPSLPGLPPPSVSEGFPGFPPSASPPVEPCRRSPTGGLSPLGGAPEQAA
ncbi:MAG TPA: hypothetical protein VLT33_33655 [Labilithrix sp.]|nr:hypothetical protein [Labilithrix sp.]